MATLHLMVGLPGSGKTTEAIKLERKYKALRFTPDEWQYFLFGHDISDPKHDERHTKIEELMWEIAEKVLEPVQYLATRILLAYFFAILRQFFLKYIQYYGEKLPLSGKKSAAQSAHVKILNRLLKSGVDVILDFGFWTKSERDEFRRKAHSFGADFTIHYMDVPNDVIWERLSVRNTLAGKNAIFYVGKKKFDEWSGLFEIPTKEELDQ